MIRYRFLLREFLIRDLKARYTGSLFGFLWAFVHPLWQLSLYSIVFSLILRVPLENEGTKSFPIFLFAGLLPWMALSEALKQSTLKIVESGLMVKKLRFPSALLVVSVVLSALIHSAVAAAIFFVLRLWQGGIAWMQLPLFLFCLCLQVALTLGFAWFLAATYVYLRDIQHGLELVLSAIFYLTPMVYPVAMVPERSRWLIELNPLSTVVGAYRAFLLGSRPPPATALAVLAVVSASACVGGYLLFRRLARGFADEL